MAGSRIFPTQKQAGGIASEKEIATINVDRLAELLESDEIKQGVKLPDNFTDLIANVSNDTVITSCNDMTDEKEEEACDSKAESDDSEITKGITHEEIPMKRKESSSRMKKVHFASYNDISADSIRKAESEGAEELKRAILSARQDWRKIMGERIASLETKDQTETQEKIAARDNYRKQIAAKADDKIKTATASIEEAVKEQKAEKIQITVKQSASKLNTGFKKVAELSNSEKQAFAEIAIANDFDADYVQAILGQNEEAEVVNADVENIKSVMSSDIPLNTKKAALTSMIKIAKLDESQRNRIVDYWVNELKYGDPEWVQALVKDYSND